MRPPTDNALVLGNLCEYRHKYFWLHFCRRKYRCIFNHFYVMRFESYRIRWNNAVQGHSRSPILVPIESSYATSYLWLIPTYLLTCTVSEIYPSVGPKYLYSATLLRLAPPPFRRRGSPGTISVEFYLDVNAKVPNGLETLANISTGWVGRTNVSHERQTDGRRQTFA